MSALVLWRGVIAGLALLAGMALIDVSQSHSVLAPGAQSHSNVRLANGPSASALHLSPQAQLDAALSAALSRLGGHLPGAAGASASSGAHSRPSVQPPGALLPSVRGFACPVASRGLCSASPCRRFIGSASGSPVAPVDGASAVYEINTNGTARSLADQAGSSICFSTAPPRALPISSTR